MIHVSLCICVDTLLCVCVCYIYRDEWPVVVLNGACTSARPSCGMLSAFVVLCLSLGCLFVRACLRARARAPVCVSVPVRHVRNLYHYPSSLLVGCFLVRRYKHSVAVFPVTSTVSSTMYGHRAPAAGSIADGKRPGSRRARGWVRVPLETILPLSLTGISAAECTSKRVNDMDSGENQRELTEGFDCLLCAIIVYERWLSYDWGGSARDWQDPLIWKNKNTVFFFFFLMYNFSKYTFRPRTGYFVQSRLAGVVQCDKCWKK